MLSRLRGPLLIAAGALMLCWPAFYNGYPLQWYDSLGYLYQGWSGTYHLLTRSPFYSLWITPLLALHSEWPIVLAQGALAAAMIFLVLRTLTGRLQPGFYLATVGFLALLTGLSWHSSYIMADMFAPLVALGIFLLTFARDRLAWWERAFVFAVTALASLVHYSHLPLAAALCLAAPGLLCWQRAQRAQMVRAGAVCLALVSIAIGGQVAMQWLENGEPAVAPYGPVFLLARLAEDGEAKDYLTRHCPEANLRFCAFAQDLPMTSDHFLWAADGPVKKLGGVKAARDEAAQIAAGAIGEEPLRFLIDSLANAMTQFVRIDTEGYVRSYRGGVAQWKETLAQMQVRLPGEVGAFTQSRESVTGIDQHGLFSPQPAIATVSAIALVAVCAAGGVWRDRRLRALIGLVLVALIVNAAVCGALSAPSERYQSRMIWLVPFLLILAVLTAIEGQRKPSAAA